MNNITYIYIDTWDRLRFFKRFDSILSNIIYFTEQLSIHLYLISKKSNSKLIVRNKLISKFSVNELSADIIASCKFEKVNVFIFNGHTDVAKKIKLKTSQHADFWYFEVGNWPGKTFIDHCGVNLESSIYRNKAFLSSPKKINFEERNVYKPQQTSSYFKINFSGFIDRLGRLLGAHNYPNRPFLEFIGKFIPKSFWLKTFKYRHKEYNKLLILQLPSDNSIKDQFTKREYFYWILNHCKSCKKTILSIHPATTDILFLFFLKYINLKYDADVVFGTTLDIMNASRDIYTFNSSTTLLARANGLQINCDGECFFRNWTDENISWYVNEKLASLDYFSNEEITDSEFFELSEKRNK